MSNYETCVRLQLYGLLLLGPSVVRGCWTEIREEVVRPWGSVGYAEDNFGSMSHGQALGRSHRGVGGGGVDGMVVVAAAVYCGRCCACMSDRNIGHAGSGG